MLIWCSISGYGQTGHDRLEAGYDGKIQAMAGIMSITGHAETGPMRAGFAVCDTLTGRTAAFAISSALFQRTHTGKGRFVDVSMLEATLAFLCGQVADFTVSGHRQQQSGSQPSRDRQSVQGLGRLRTTCRQQRETISLSKETLNKWIPLMVRQAHHERNQQLTVRPEPVEGLVQRLPN